MHFKCASKMSIEGKLGVFISLDSSLSWDDKADVHGRGGEGGVFGVALGVLC